MKLWHNSRLSGKKINKSFFKKKIKRGQNSASSLELKDLQDKNYKHKLEIASKNEQIAQIKINTEKEERRKKDMDSIYFFLKK